MKKSVNTFANMLIFMFAQTFVLNATKDDMIEFIKAIQGGDINKITEFFVTDIDPNLEFYSNISLIIAIWWDHVNIFRLLADRETIIYKNVYKKDPLINMGADVNAKEINGWTTLMFATMHGDIESVINLIEANANVNL